MTRLRRFLALVPGNPMNPVTVLVLGFFGLILLGFPPFMRALGLDTGGIVLVMAIVVLTALAVGGLTMHIARRYLRDYEQLIGGSGGSTGGPPRPSGHGSRHRSICELNTRPASSPSLASGSPSSAGG